MWPDTGYSRCMRCTIPGDNSHERQALGSLNHGQAATLAALTQSIKLTGMRMRFYSIALALLLAMVCTTTSVAADSTNDKIAAGIRASLKTLDSTIPVESVSPTPVKDLYEVVLAGSHVLYVSADGQYLIQGDLLKLENGKANNLTDGVRVRATKSALSEVNRQDMVIFSPKGTVKGAIYAFTDVDCGYCRKLHNEVGELNRMGIEVRYLAFPRAGEGSPSYQKMVSAWCSSDRNKAMTTLKNGGSVMEKTCANPVMAQYELGAKLGVRGTPAIYLEDGTAIPGYRPAADIAETMRLAAGQPAAK